MTAKLTDRMPLIDSFGRAHNNLRISVTDRCNLRCTYCMPEDATFLHRSEILTFEEITQFVRIAVSLGIDKVRLTGGEPLLRSDLSALIQQLCAITELKDIGLTTNGILLAEHATKLHQAGLRRLNISLDSLNAATFHRLARRDGLNRVLDGIEAALLAHYTSIKLNAVIIRGVNDDEIAPLVRYALQRNIEMRFIEFMPIGGGGWQRDQVVLAHEILERIESELGPLVPATEYDPRAPAMDFRFVDRPGHVGIIASVSRPFCRKCNRIRLTADGKIRNCLFAHDERDIKTMLRGGNANEIATSIRQCIAEKWEGHEINSAHFLRPKRTMHAIGG